MKPHTWKLKAFVQFVKLKENQMSGINPCFRLYRVNNSLYVIQNKLELNPRDRGNLMGLNTGYIMFALLV